MVKGRRRVGIDKRNQKRKKDRKWRRNALGKERGLGGMGGMVVNGRGGSKMLIESSTNNPPLPFCSP